MNGTPKPRILLLTENFPPTPGGTARWFYNLYSRLGEYRTIIVTKKMVDKQWKNLNIRYIDWPLQSWTLMSVRNWKSMKIMVTEVLQLIRKNAVKVVHVGRCQPEGVIALICKLLSNIPYIVYVHGEDIEMAWRCREYRWVVRQVLRFAQRLVANSRFTAELLVRKWKLSHSKVRILYPGVDTRYFRPAEQGKPGTDRFVILCPGRLQRRKGQDVLLKAVALLKRQVPDIHMIIAGDGPDRDWIRSMISQLELNSTVSWVPAPNDEELLGYYRRADLVVLPNRTIEGDCEGFGMVLIEAQACSKPILCGLDGGTRETLLPGKTGFIVDCRRPDVLAEAIGKLYQAQNILPKLGQLGRQWVRRMFDWSILVPKARRVLGSDL